MTLLLMKTLLTWMKFLHHQILYQGRKIQEKQEHRCGTLLITLHESVCKVPLNIVHLSFQVVFSYKPQLVAFFVCVQSTVICIVVNSECLNTHVASQILSLMTVSGFADAKNKNCKQFGLFSNSSKDLTLCWYTRYINLYMAMLIAMYFFLVMVDQTLYWKIFSLFMNKPNCSGNNQLFNSMYTMRHRWTRYIWWLYSVYPFLLIQ